MSTVSDSAFPVLSVGQVPIVTPVTTEADRAKRRPDRFAVVLCSPDGKPLAVCFENLTLAAAEWHAGGFNSRLSIGAPPNRQLIIPQKDLADFHGLPSWFDFLVSYACAKGGEGI